MAEKGRCTGRRATRFFFLVRCTKFTERLYAEIPLPLAHNPLALEPRRALDDLVHERIGVPAVDVRYGIADAEGLGQAVDGEGGDLDRAVPRPSFICLRDPQPLAVSGRV